MDIEKYDVVVFLHSLFLDHTLRTTWPDFAVDFFFFFFLWVRFPGEYLNFWVLPNIMWFLCHAVLCAGMFEEASNFQKYFSRKLGRLDLLLFIMKPFFVVVLKDLYNILYRTLFPDIWNIFQTFRSDTVQFEWVVLCWESWLFTLAYWCKVNMKFFGDLGLLMKTFKFVGPYAFFHLMLRIYFCYYKNNVCLLWKIWKIQEGHKQ